MAPVSVRALAKLAIIPLNSETLKPNGIPFLALYNPTTVTLSSGAVLAKKPTTNKFPGDLSLLYQNNRTLSVDLFLDGTGASPPLGVPIGKAFGAVSKAIPGGSVSSITAQAATQAALSAFTVTQFVNWFFHLTGTTEGKPARELTSEELTKIIDKKNHTAKPLKIIWGLGLRFRCKLTDATVSYSLFNQLGQPLRGKISATFAEIPGNKFNPFQSPDLTKVHLVKAGDTI
ncbi:MAG TPA: hypothetical protein VFJ43_03135, partial [Bacteroidia bacterium]|nr:hypothetical protein [Bacteroidia bacterium]